MVSVDGYFEGKNNDISWHRVDKEVNDFVIRQAYRSRYYFIWQKDLPVNGKFLANPKGN